MEATREKFAYEKAKQRATELDCPYQYLFTDVIWDDNICGIAETLKDKEFVIATTQTNVFSIIYKICLHGFKIKETICIKDGCVYIYGIVIQPIHYPS